MWHAVIKIALAGLSPTALVADAQSHQSKVVATLEICLTATERFDKLESTLKTVGWLEPSSASDKAAFSKTMYGIDLEGRLNNGETHFRGIIETVDGSSVLSMREEVVSDRPLLTCHLKSTQKLTFNSIAMNFGGKEVEGLGFHALEYPSATLVYRLRAETVFANKPVVQIDTLLNLTPERNLR